MTVEPLQILDEERNVLIPRAKLGVDEYALQRRFLAAKAGTRFAGPWSHDMCPYTVEIMQSLSDMLTREVWLMCCAQWAKTEIGFNLFARTLEEEPAPVIFAMPTEKDAEKRMKRLIVPTFEVMPSLRKHLPGGRLSELNIGTATVFDNMLLFLVWAGSAAMLADTAAKIVIADEIGKWPQLSGIEADPVNLLRERMTTYKGVGKLYGPSTPTVSDSLIEREFLAGDQRKWWVKCPFCDQRHVMVWDADHVPLARNSAGSLLSKRDYEMGGDDCSWYVCPHCEKKWDEARRWQAVSAGVWAPRDCKVDPAGRIIGKVFTNPHRSYHGTAMMLNPAFRTISDLAAQWSDAQEQKKKGDKGPLKDFINSRLGESWKEYGAHAEEDVVRLRVSDEFSDHTVPNDCQLLVAGADYHEDHNGNVRIDYVITGYGPSERNYDIAVGSIPSFEHLENEIFHAKFPWSDTDLESPELVVSLLAIDSGYKPEEVYGFCDRWPGRAVPTKGASHAQRTPVVLSNIKPDNKRRKSRRLVKPGVLYVVDTGFFKDIVFRWINGEWVEGPGSTIFYAECPKWYTDELCNEQKVKVVKGARVSWQWQPVSGHAATHGLDIKVCATVAGYLQGAQYLRPANQRTATRKRRVAKNKRFQ